MKKLSINQASVVALFTQLVAIVIAIVPQWTPEHQAIIAGGTAIIAAVFLLAHGIVNGISIIHDMLMLKTPSAGEIESQVDKLVQDELRKRLGQLEA